MGSVGERTNEPTERRCDSALVSEPQTEIHPSTPTVRPLLLILSLSWNCWGTLLGISGNNSLLDFLFVITHRPGAATNRSFLISFHIKSVGQKTSPQIRSLSLLPQPIQPHPIAPQIRFRLAALLIFSSSTRKQFLETNSFIHLFVQIFRFF